MRDYVLIDFCRVLLIVCVIGLHCPMAWTLGQWWPVDLSPKTSLLNGFMAVNDAFCVAFFFFISGYLHPRAVDKSNLWMFLKKRILRLGMPMLVYLVAIVPVIMYVYYLKVRQYGYLSFRDYYIHIYWGINSHCPPDWTGPTWSDQQLLQMWFSQHLLIFGFIYVLWRFCAKPFLTVEQVTVTSTQRLKPFHVHLCLLGYSLILGLVYYWVRLEHLIYQWIGLFDAIQLEFARFPQRASLFVLGMIAYRRQWLARLPKHVSFYWGGLGLVLVILVYTRLSEFLIPFTAGGVGLKAFCYAQLDAFLGTSVIMGILALFHRDFSVKLCGLARILSRNVYCVYMVHLPIVVLIQYALANVPAHPAILSLLTALLSIALSFSFSHYMVLRIPKLNQWL